VDVQSADAHGRSLRLWLVRTGARGQRHLRAFDRFGEDLKVIERNLARSALADDLAGAGVQRGRSQAFHHFIPTLALDNGEQLLLERATTIYLRRTAIVFSAWVG
jgi:hypothetical protein